MAVYRFVKHQTLDEFNKKLALFSCHAVYMYVMMPTNVRAVVNVCDVLNIVMMFLQ